MEYLWPARRKRDHTNESVPLDVDALPLPPSTATSPISPGTPSAAPTPSRIHIPARRASVDIVSSTSPDRNLLMVPTLRKTAASRSFTDLRKAASDTLQVPSSPLSLQRTKSSDAVFTLTTSSSSGQVSKVSEDRDKDKQRLKREVDDAALMKTRSSQKTFVWVKVSRYACHFRRYYVFSMSNPVLQPTPGVEHHEGRLFPLP